MDADCDPGQACVPGAYLVDGRSWPSCIDARCITGADCGACGACGACGVSSFWWGCGTFDTLACRGSGDGCHGDGDCGDAWGEACSWTQQGFACTTPDCAE